MVLSLTCIHSQRTGASVCLFCRRAVRRRGAGRALVVVGDVSLQVSYRRKQTIMHSKEGKNIKTDCEGAAVR